MDSETIKNMIEFFENAETEYNTAYNAVNVEDKRTQDLLHKLELGALGTRERNKVAKALEECRISRRYNKDRVEVLEPIVSYKREHKKAIDCFKNLLGVVRKVEKYHSDRIYIPRVEAEQ